MREDMGALLPKCNEWRPKILSASGVGLRAGFQKGHSGLAFYPCRFSPYRPKPKGNKKGRGKRLRGQSRPEGKDCLRLGPMHSGGWYVAAEIEPSRQSRIVSNR